MYKHLWMYELDYEVHGPKLTKDWRRRENEKGVQRRIPDSEWCSGASGGERVSDYYSWCHECVKHVESTRDK